MEDLKKILVKRERFERFKFRAGLPPAGERSRDGVQNERTPDSRKERRDSNREHREINYHSYSFHYAVAGRGKIYHREIFNFYFSELSCHKLAKA